MIMPNSSCANSGNVHQNLSNFREDTQTGQNGSSRRSHKKKGNNSCNSIEFLQVNLHHCVSAVQHFDQSFKKKLSVCHRNGSEAIALIQEPYQRFNRATGFSNEYKVISGPGKGVTRACIAVSKKLNFWLLTQFSNEDQVAIVVKSNNKFIVIVSLYMDGLSSELPPPTFFRNLVNYCDEKHYGLLVGTDANSHHTAWASTDINDRGEHLLHYLLSKNLHFVNSGSKPTYHNISRTEVLDLTIVNNVLLEDICDWKVSDEENFSDHNNIEFKLDLNVNIKAYSFRNVRQTDWSLYQEKVEEGMRIIRDNNMDLDTQAEYLNKVLLTAYNESCKEYTCTKKGKKPPWWHHDLTILKRQVNKHRRRVNRNRTEENLETYRQARKVYKMR